MAAMLVSGPIPMSVNYIFLIDIIINYSFILRPVPLSTERNFISKFQLLKKACVRTHLITHTHTHTHTYTHTYTHTQIYAYI